MSEQHCALGDEVRTVDSIKGDHGYRLTYEIKRHDPPLTEEQLKRQEGDVGACDSLLICSVMGDPDPGTATGISALWFGVHGEKDDELTPDAEFKLWALLAHRLIDRLPDGGRRDLVTQVREAIRSALHAQAGSTETP